MNGLALPIPRPVYAPPMATPLLILRDIHLTFGGAPLLEGAQMSVSEGERLCLVGRNGSGKSTLLKIAAGMIELEHGDTFLQPGTTVRYLPQEPDLSGFETSLAFVEAGLGPGDDPYRAMYLLEQMGLDGSEHPDRLSGGEARRCALARALAPEPDILLLDEPTNHLDLPAIEWLEEELAGSRSALVLISHDRRFLEKLSRATLWLNQGQTRRQERNFSEFEQWRDQAMDQQALDRHKLDRKIAAETDWLRTGVTARRKRNQGRLRALHALRAARREQRRVTGSVSLDAAKGVQSGKLVIEATGISKSYGGLAVVREFSTRVQRGDRIGLVGPNGAGKTTLLNLLTGVLTPDVGTVCLGKSLQTVALDQRRQSLDPNSTLADVLTEGRGETVSVGGQSRHVIGYMKDFLFAPEQARTPVGALSGGERGRLTLACALARPSNLLVLDEPTNDLDLETLDLLQEMLNDYAGTVLLVSHDRDFLDRTVTSVIASAGAGRWVEYAGGYSDMVTQRGGGVAEESEIKTPLKSKTSPARSQLSNADRSSRPSSRLTFKDKHALETLPAHITKLTAEISDFEVRIADPDLYNRDPTAFAAVTAGLDKSRTELAAVEEQWLELEIKRETVERK
jgi:ATP-binding cassette subfamily F protein uup